jgi:hypothetical protein
MLQYLVNEGYIAQVKNLPPGVMKVGRAKNTPVYQVTDLFRQLLK